MSERTCIICHRPLPKSARFFQRSCDVCLPIYWACYTSVDDAVRHVIPTMDDVDDLLRCLDHERAHAQPRGSLIEAIERRIRKLERAKSVADRGES